MPGRWTTHARQCAMYEGLRDDDAPPARARAAEGEGVQVGLYPLYRTWSERPYALGRTRPLDLVAVPGRGGPSARADLCG